MSGEVRFTKERLAWVSLWGIARGVSVHSLIYPLEVIKIRLQCAQGESRTSRIALTMFRQEGMGAFYKGLTPQLIKTSIKQVWCWPMMIGMPCIFQGYQIGNLGQQALTGLTIATMDAAISTPLERAKILSAFRGKSTFSLKNTYKDGWRGFTAHWSKLTVNWMTFLIAQKYFRDQARGPSDEPLSLPQRTKIGAQVALVVSAVSAPFDVANTLKQAQNLSPSHLFSQNGIFKWYRGWPLSALSLVIHNVASVIVIEEILRGRWSLYSKYN